MTTRFVDPAATFVTGLTEGDAYTTLGAAITAAAAGDIIKCNKAKTETAGAAITYVMPTTAGLQILSVTFNGLGTGALTAGYTANVGAASAAFTITSGFAYIYGITFAAGTNNNSNCNVVIGNASGTATGLLFDTCTLSAPSASTVAAFSLSTNGGARDHLFSYTNCVFSHGAIRAMNLRSGTITIDGGSLAGTGGTTVFNISASNNVNTKITGMDLSGAGTNPALVNIAGNSCGYVVMRQCKLKSGFTVTTGTFPSPNGVEVELVDCDSGDNNYKYFKSNYSGTIVASNSIYADATNGTDSFSLLMTASANAKFEFPLVSPYFGYFNSTLSAMTTTVEVDNDGTTFTDAQLWQETLAKITSGFPLGTWNRGDRVADILTAGANQTTSTKTWTGTGGFGAEVKQKLVSTSFTPAEIGPITTVVKLAKASGSVYVSPAVLASSSKTWMNYNDTFLNEQPSVASGVRINPGLTGGLQ